MDEKIWDEMVWEEMEMEIWKGNELDWKSEGL